MNNSTTSSIKGNVTNVPGHNPFYRTQPTIIAQVTSLTVLGVIIVVGNLASVITFIKTQSLRRRSHYLIISLSVADLLVGVVDFMCVYFFWTGPQWNTFIVVLEVLDTLTGIVSILTLSNISIERFYAIFFPFRHRMLRFRAYVALILLPWITSTYITTLYIISHVYDQSIFEIYAFHTFAIGTIALLVISVSYITIGIKMRQNNLSARNQNLPSRDQKLVVTLLIVTLASIITWLPLQCFIVRLYFCNNCLLPHFNVLFAMKFLQFCNSGINVFIYIVRMPEFRNAFLVLFCGKSRANLRGQDSTRMMSSVKNNGYIGDEHVTAQDRSKPSSFNNLQSTKNTQSGNSRTSCQINNSNLQNRRGNSCKTNLTNQNSRSCHNGNQDDKESVLHNTNRPVTQATDVTKKADSSLNKIDINLGEMIYESASQQGSPSNMEGAANYACETEYNETRDTRL